MKGKKKWKNMNRTLEICEITKECNMCNWVPEEEEREN